MYTSKPKKNGISEIPATYNLRTALYTNTLSAIIISENDLIMQMALDQEQALFCTNMSVLCTVTVWIFPINPSDVDNFNWKVESDKSECLAMNCSGPFIVILFFRDPHLLKSV